MADGDMARLFHRLTSYEPGREWTDVPDDPWLVDTFEPNDLSTMPPAVKSFPEGLPEVELPRVLPRPSGTALEVLAGRATERAQLDLGHLARLLHLSAGVVRTTTARDGRFILFRAAGSAGGRFPLEVYVVVPDGTPDLPPGVHAYRPVEHALLQVGPPPETGPPGLVITGVPWRTGWRYRERGYRHVFWDAGTLLSQQLALAASVGLNPCLVTDFPDVELRDLVGADGIHELPVAVVGFGEPPRWAPRERAVAGSHGAGPVVFPLVTAAHWAGVGTDWGVSWPAGEPLPAELPETPPLDDVIYRRGSTRLMNPTARIPREIMEVSLAVALRGIEVPHFVAVHGVEDAEPGLYRWPDLARPIVAGDLRAELRRIALGQGLAGDAAFVAIGAADLRGIVDRRYRELQLAAGLVEGRLHLAAYGLGIGASGMTFLDSEIPALVEDELEAMLFTCVGVPEYRNTRGGPPGEPVTIRQITPRLDD